MIREQSNASRNNVPQNDSKVIPILRICTSMSKGIVDKNNTPHKEVMEQFSLCSSAVKK